MNCNDLCKTLPAFVLGELSEEESAECELHLETCELCRYEASLYRSMVAEIADAPGVSPTMAESMALGAEIRKLSAVRSRKVSRSNRPVFEMLGFALVSASVFAIILYRIISSGGVVSAIDSVNPITGVSIALVLGMVTALFSVLLTAWRKPLNGMTFRR